MSIKLYAKPALSTTCTLLHDIIVKDFSKGRKELHVITIERWYRSQVRQCSHRWILVVEEALEPVLLTAHCL